MFGQKEIITLIIHLASDGNLKTSLRCHNCLRTLSYQGNIHQEFFHETTMVAISSSYFCFFFYIYKIWSAKVAD